MKKFMRELVTAFLLVCVISVSVLAAGGKNYVGNLRNSKLHSITCTRLPYEKNRIYFSTLEEAFNAGYTDIHKECLKNESKGKK